MFPILHTLNHVRIGAHEPLKLAGMPAIAASLISAGIVEYVNRMVDSVTGEVITLVRPMG